MNLIKSTLAVALSSIIAIIFFEIFLQIKNSYISPNYDIEMWRYSKELKKPSNNLLISHEHVPNSSSILQDVLIEIDDMGMRVIEDAPKDDYDSSIIFIGSSITLGWGVESKYTFPALIQKQFNTDGKKWRVYNAGVGNYNTSRYVHAYLDKYKDIPHDYLVIGYFVNDTETLIKQEGNFFTRNFMFSVPIWKVFQSYTMNDMTLVEYYEDLYNEKYKGFIDMKTSLKKVSRHCVDNDINCILVSIPDIHQSLQKYELSFINQKMLKISNELGFHYIDAIEGLRAYDNNSLWNNYGDPHPNKIGHKIIADLVYEKLNAIQ